MSSILSYFKPVSKGTSKSADENKQTQVVTDCTSQSSSNVDLTETHKPLKDETDSVLGQSTADGDTKTCTDCDSAGAVAGSTEISKKMKKDQKKRKTGVDPSWTKTHPWLLVTSDGHGMLCKLCRRFDKRPRSGSLVWIDVPCVSITMQAVKRHHATTMHKDSVLMEAESRATGGIEHAIAQNVSMEKMAIIGAMKCLYLLAEEEEPHTTKYSSLLNFCKGMGCTYLDGMDLGGNAHYTSERVVQEMLATMGGMIRDQLYGDLRNSPFYSILVDETTDIAVLKQLIVYARYLVSGKVKTSFVAIEAIENGKAETITKEIKDFLTKSEVPLIKMRGLGSDGASVMVGKHNGVAARLKKENPKITSIHCIAHRLALGAAQAADGVPYMKKFKDLLGALFNYYENSAVRMAGFKEIQALLGDPLLKLKKASNVRWLSHQMAVQTLRKILPSVITSLEYEATERSDPTASGLAKFLNTYNFAATICMLCDVLPHLGSLSKIFQRQDIDFTMVEGNVQAAIATFEGYMVQPGHHLQGLEEWLTTGLVSCNIVRTNMTEESFQRQIAKPFLTNLVENMKDRFQDSQILKRYTFLDPELLSAEDGLFFDQEQKENLKHLCKHLDLSETATTNEWEQFRERMSSELKDKTLRQTLMMLAEKFQDLYPNLAAISSTALVLPVSTADCERGFSALKRIKTRLRSRLSQPSLNMLLFISVEGPPVADFDFEEAAKLWLALKPRRISF